MAHNDFIAKKIKGTSMCVQRFIPELSDDPHPRLDYRIIPYVEVRALHKLFESNRSITNRYSEIALGVIGNGISFPNLLATAIVIIVGNYDPQVLIAYRKLRPGGSRYNFALTYLFW